MGFSKESDFCKKKKKKTPNTAKNVQHSSRKRKIPFKWPDAHSKKYSQIQWSNKVGIVEAQTSIAFSEVPRFGVKWQISTKRENISTNHSREVNNRIRC